jgi:hypothetical protein
MSEEAAERAPVECRREREQRAECKARERHQRDELDGGLPTLGPQRGLQSSQSRAKSIGLTQSLTIWSAPESGTVCRGAVSGCRNP